MENAFDKAIEVHRVLALDEKHFPSFSWARPHFFLSLDDKLSRTISKYKRKKMPITLVRDFEIQLEPGGQGAWVGANVLC